MNAFLPLPNHMVDPEGPKCRDPLNSRLGLGGQKWTHVHVCVHSPCSTPHSRLRRLHSCVTLHGAWPALPKSQSWILPFSNNCELMKKFSHEFMYTLGGRWICITRKKWRTKFQGCMQTHARRILHFPSLQLGLSFSRSCIVSVAATYTPMMWFN